MFPIPDVFDFDAYFAGLGGGGHVIGGDDGVVIIPEPPVIDDPISISDPDSRTYFATMDLDPYRKKLDSTPQIRYLYTGREYNVETGDYYYRWRVVDTSIGRFTSKDHIDVLNLYFYTDDDPINSIDSTGLFTVSIGLKGDAQGPLGANEERGFSFGWSKDCGWTFGLYKKKSKTATAGATIGGGVSIAINNRESVAQNAGD